MGHQVFGKLAPTGLCPLFLRNGRNHVFLEDPEQQQVCDVDRRQDEPGNKGCSEEGTDGFADDV